MQPTYATNPLPHSIFGPPMFQSKMGLSLTNISSHISKKSTEITDIHPEILATRILSRIDIRSVASMALTSQEFHALCIEQKVWNDICNSTWTSTKHPLVENVVSTFPGGHCKFLSDSIPILYSEGDNCPRDTSLVQRAEHLISAVDVKYKNIVLCSEVTVTDSVTENFDDSIFKVEVLVDNEKSLSIPVNCEDDEDMYMSDLKENMTLSWIMIDPTQKRAANISSQVPVSVRPHWIDGDIEIKFSIIMSDFVEIRITAMLKWGADGKSFVLSKVRLQLRDIDSTCLCGEKSLKILQEAIRSGKRKKARRGDETRIHKKYLDMKWERRQEKQKRKSKKTQLIATISVAFIILLVHLRFSGLALVITY